MYCSFGVLFIAQVYRIDLSVQQQITMLLILMVTSKGIAGVPRAGLIVIAASLAYFGLPEQGLVICARRRSCARHGAYRHQCARHAVASVMVAKWEGELAETGAPTT